MAVATQGSPSVNSLVRRALERQASLARARFTLTRGQVQQILYKFQKNNASSYKELLNILRDWPLSDENCMVLLEDSQLCLMMMGPETRGLVEGICNLDWVGRDENFLRLYKSFILDLVTAHNYHTPTVFAALLKKFKVEYEMWDDEPPAEAVKRWSTVHNIIAEIVALMPMSTDLLLQIIVEQFPYYKASSSINRSYLHNLIWITRYIPLLLEKIMTAIVSRLIMLDVGSMESAKQAIADKSFSMEVDCKDVSLEDTMDFCMCEMLHWLMNERDRVLVVMCNVFERIVLPTHGTRYIQFLLLTSISISQQCADRVLGNLWDMAAGLSTNGLGGVATRRTAAAHLSGLLARCVRLPNTRLVKYLGMMAQWCHDYIKATQESTTAMCDSVKMHGAFHSICHAIFYLVAFKHNTLFANKESINFVENLNLPRLVTCALNPLRACPPAVARAFASVTRAHQVVYCQPIIDKNARLTLHDETQGDSWFPYDPYTLNRSGKLIWPLCVEYKEWLNESGDDTQYTSRVNKSETEQDDFMFYTSSKVRLESLSNCVAPGFKYL